MAAADRVEIRAVTAAPGTTQAKALETDLSFDPGTVSEIEIVIPAGHAGLTGLAIAQAHGIIIPASGTDWITSDDEVIRWPVQDFLNNGSWSAFAYNLDPTYEHTWFIRFLVAENTPQTVVSPPPAVIPADQIQAAASGLTGG